MARLDHRLAENAQGEFFVDDTCIDCGICRWVAPRSFARSDATGLSYVRDQPDSEPGTTRALMALVACPTSSIGTVSRMDAGAAASAFPERLADTIFFCGYASKHSYGAASYLIQRAEGNVLIDSPRAASPLMTQIERLGGIRWMFLTHRDDVADHEAFHRRFGCDRILHRADASSETADLEMLIEGVDPIALAPDLTVVPVPGHTRGSSALLYRGAAGASGIEGSPVLFTGDHLWGDLETGELDASRGVCWYSWPEQIRSMERLLSLRFSWVLPGHGDPLRAASPEAMHERLEALVARMKREGRRGTG